MTNASFTSFLQLLLLSLSLLAACGPANQNEQAALPKVDTDDPGRLSAQVFPVAQQLTLNMDLSLDDYSGHTTITINLAEDASEIRLHAEDLQIQALSLSADGQRIGNTIASLRPGEEKRALDPVVRVE